MFCENGIGTGMQMSGGHAEYMVAYADAYKRRSDGLVWIKLVPSGTLSLRERLSCLI
jgi:D-arabinose 1-dehydrogenase-like Zn-dependent alcohol dehydrogenase